MLKICRIFFVLLFCCFTLLGVKAITRDNLIHNVNKPKELNIFVWTDVLDLEIINEFEKKHNVHIHLHFYNSNEELIAKLINSKGKGYDILFPSYYACNQLIDKGMIKKLDQSKIDFAKNIYPFLLNRESDIGNLYTIPYIWESYGIAYNPLDIQKQYLTTADLFNTDKKLVMTPDPIEAVCIAANYLYPNISNYSNLDTSLIEKTLIAQKKNVEAYADFRAKDLVASGNASICLMKTSYIDSLKKCNPNITFTLPKDVIFTSVECAVICKESKNDDLCYEFLRFIFQPENMARSVEQFPMFPSIPEALEYTTDHHPQFTETITEISDREEDLMFFDYILNINTIDDIIIKTKT